ncbi:MAG: hypothetical protein JWM11_6455, partial [Planctomycetaceae bacterium]|nr:hypothetical protein [Planctomycetaceae bacterium]
EIIRAVGKFEQLEAMQQIRRRIIELKRRGHSHQSVADELNREGLRSTSGGSFTSPIISQICGKLRQAGYDLTVNSPETHHWILGHLARHLGIKSETLSTWRRRGWVRSERVGARWILSADPQELERLKRLVEHSRKGLEKTPLNLTTPIGSEVPGVST